MQVIDERQRRQAGIMSPTSDDVHSASKNRKNLIIVSGPFLVRDGLKTTIGASRCVLRGAVMGIDGEVACSVMRVFERQTTELFLGLT